MRKFCLLSLIAVALAATGCRRDLPEGESRGGEIDMHFTVTVPGETPTPAYTRAAGDDTAIDNLDLLVFSGDVGSADFVGRRQATDIEVVTTNATTGAATYTFTARLRTTTDSCVIYFVANSRNADSSDRLDFGSVQLLPGTTDGEVMNSVRTTELPQTAVPVARLVPIIMWGKIELDAIASREQPAEHVKLLRTVAAVVVKKATSQQNGLNLLTIHAVSAGNVASSAAVAPWEWESWNNTNASTPGDVFGSSPSVVRHFGASASTGYWSPATEQHYVNESVGTKPYIIIDATYSGKRGFYKLDMKDATGARINFIRNHRYFVNITKVSGAGYQSLEQAVVGPPSNDVIQALVDDHEELVSFIADSQGYMGWSNEQVTLIYNGNTAARELCKVYSSRGLSASGISYTGTGLASPPTVSFDVATGLTTISGTPTGAGSGTLKITDGVLTVSVTVTVQ